MDAQTATCMYCSMDIENPTTEMLNRHILECEKRPELGLMKRIKAIEKATRKLIDAAGEITRMDDLQLVAARKQFDWKNLRDAIRGAEEAMKDEN